MNDAFARVVERNPTCLPACAEGCSYCCHVHAYATLPEILAVAAHLRDSLDPEAFAQFRARLSAHVERVRDLDDEARWDKRIPCALLDARGSCSIHPARPLRCRAFHSCDKVACQSAFEGRSEALPVGAPILDRSMNAVEEGYDAALEEHGLSTEGFKLEVALAIVLDDPNAADKGALDAAR